MTTETTAAGNSVLVMDEAEFATYLDREVQVLTGLRDAAAFLDALAAGTVDDSDPAVSELLVLLGAGQRGD